MAEVTDQRWKYELEDLLGAANLCSAPGERFQYVWSELTPKAAVLPDSREQVAEVVRLAAPERLVIVPFGRGTKLRMGGAGERADIAVSLERLNRVCDYPASDLTITVEAGLPVRSLESTLAAKGQMLPLDVPFAESGTVGGTIAANINGARRLAYGTWRDMVLGVQYVTAEGKFAKGGGKVVKNVAGYDIPKLLIGSHGTLGILLEITFKVFPTPSASKTYVAAFPSARHALGAALELVRSQLPLQAVELVDPQAAALLPTMPVPSGNFLLAARGAGTEQVLRRVEREIHGLLRRCSATAAEAPDNEGETEVWDGIRDLMPKFVEKHAEGMIVKASLSLTSLDGFVSYVAAVCNRENVSSATLVRVGSGIVYVCLPPSNGQSDGAGEVLCRLADELIQEAEQRGGRGIVEWCPAKLKSKVKLWGTTRDDFASMRQLKAALDPNHILGPGRFYGGI